MKIKLGGRSRDLFGDYSRPDPLNLTVDGEARSRYRQPQLFLRTGELSCASQRLQHPSRRIGRLCHTVKSLTGGKETNEQIMWKEVGTTTEEPQAVPEKKMRSADDAPSVESEDESNTITSGPDSGGRESHAKRSEEARARRHAKRNWRQNARKANTSASKNKTEIDGTQEAEETEGTGKWVMSSEYSHGLN